MNINVVFLFAVSLLLCGCERQQNAYYLGYVNKTGHDLNDVSLYVNGESFGGCGFLSTDNCATEGPWQSLPSAAELRWDDGQRHTFQTNLQRSVPDGFRDGTLYFVIRGTNSVEIKAARHDDIEANAAVRK